jgi:hypothetical protein
MKQLIGWDHAIGSDGKIGGGLGVDGSDFALAVSVKYPIAKVIEPATKALDGLLSKLEALIPGDWDKALIEKVKVEYKEELVKLLSEKVEPAPQAEQPAQV